MQHRKIIVKYNELIVIIISLLLFFQIYLQNVVRPLQFLDEIIAVVFFLYFIYKSTNRIKVVDLIMLSLIVGVALIGIVGNYTANIQTGLKPILTDMGNSLKIFMIYLGSKKYISKLERKDVVVSAIAKVMRLFVLICFVCALIQFNVDIGMGYDKRFGLTSFQFINNGAGQLGVMFYSIIMILTIDLKKENKKIYKKIYIFMALFVWATTLRARTFMFIAMYVFLYFIVIKRKQFFKINIKNIVIIIGFAIFFGMDQMETYFGNDTTARAQLLLGGIKTMKRYFPIGSGFATFGTDAASNFYSRLYREYGFDTVYGLTEDNPIFAHDTYWAAIFGQFGVIGTVIVVALIVYMVMDILKRSKYNRYCYLAGLFIAVTQVISSVATATFFNFVTLSIFFMVPLMFDDEKKSNIVVGIVSANDSSMS